MRRFPDLREIEDAKLDMLIKCLIVLLVLLCILIIVLISILLFFQNQDENGTPRFFADNRVHILFLVKKYHLKNMDRWFIHIIEAAKKNPNINIIDIWGEGWDGKELIY